MKISSLNSTSKTENKPENVLVDYDERGGVVSNFRCILADWGTSGYTYFGGTPVYAGPRTYNWKNKDLFSFGRLAVEFFEKGKGQHLHKVCFVKHFLD